MARPRLGPTSTSRLELKLPAELLHRIRRAAAGNVSAWVRRVVEDALAELEDPQLDLEREARRRSRA